jgi:hypothetical protein
MHGAGSDSWDWHWVTRPAELVDRLERYRREAGI